MEWLQIVPWQVGVMATGILSALGQAIGKRQVGQMSAFQSGLLRDLTILLVVGVVFVLQGQWDWTWVSMSFVVVGVLESMMMGAYYSTTREEMAGTVVLSYPLSGLLIVAASGVLFSEWRYFDPTRMQGLINIISLLLMLVLVMLYQGKMKVKRGWSTKLLLSSLMVVAANLVQKWAVSVAGLRPASYMIYEYLGLVAGGAVFVYGRGLDLRVGKKQLWWGVVQGLVFAISMLWYVTILVDHPLSLASMIRRVVIVTLVAGSGLWVFGEGERMSRRQWISLGLGGLVMGLMMWVNTPSP